MKLPGMHYKRCPECDELGYIKDGAPGCDDCIAKILAAERERIREQGPVPDTRII